MIYTCECIGDKRDVERAGTYKIRQSNKSVKLTREYF